MTTEEAIRKAFAVLNDPATSHALARARAKSILRPHLSTANEGNKR